MEFAALDVLQAVSVAILNLFILPLIGGWVLSKLFPKLVKMFD